MTDPTKNQIIKIARNEITEYFIYKKIAERVTHPQNKELLQKMATQEKGHYEVWRAELGHEVEPNKLKIKFYIFISRILGLSFSLQLMEKGEQKAEKVYAELAKTNPEAAEILKDEQEHETNLLKLIDEKFLQYVSSFVLGLNDALVELTGALAGLTLALQDTRLIAVVGLITGIAASMAMAASEYLSTQEEEGKNALSAGAVTGIAYFITVILLISPYLFITEAIPALFATLSMAVVIIFIFTFYTSIAKNLSFKKRFFQMALISLGVAGINFVIASVIKNAFGIDA